jgi:hypothetical protein
MECYAMMVLQGPAGLPGASRGHHVCGGNILIMLLKIAL